MKLKLYKYSTALFILSLLSFFSKDMRTMALVFTILGVAIYLKEDQIHQLGLKIREKRKVIEGAQEWKK